MTTSIGKSENARPHVAVFPSAGMAHLLPYLRLAAMLHSRGCAVSVITAHPTISNAESQYLSTFFSLYPHIRTLEIQLLPHKRNPRFTKDDPFFIQRESIANSIHLLRPLLSSLSQPLSAIFVDFPILTEFSPIAADLSLPTYTLIVTCARFFSLMVYLPRLLQQEGDISEKSEVCVPSLEPIQVSSIPPQMLDRSHIFMETLTSNVASFSYLKGVLINSFTWLEPEAIEALKSNGVDHILPIGPLEAIKAKEEEEEESGINVVQWLDEQAPKSVLFVSFGSRAHTKEQLREFAAAVEKSGWRFLWVLKTGKVDKEEILGSSFLEGTKGRGVVVKGWGDQQRILAHGAVGGFVSDCGWNSVLEAAKLGVPVLAWPPPHGDQRVNAEVVEKVGLGLWVRGWGWAGERLIGGDEIAEKLLELMHDDRLRERAKEVREKAREERESGGTSETLLRGLIASLEIRDE